MRSITLEQFWMGRDLEFPAEVTPEKRDNAVDLVKRVNDLLRWAQDEGVTIEDNPKTGSPVSSGFRSASINGQTKGAAPRSKHMECNAVDIYDPDGDLDDYCLSHEPELERIGLWLEHPSATKGWCHLQRVAPRSGRRVFYP